MDTKAETPQKMNKASLYVNSQGFPVTRHSYSGSSDFSYCAKKYELSRIVGWKEKEIRAAQEFGTCIELAVRYFHENDMDPCDYFCQTWRDVVSLEKNKNMTYSKVEVDAENLEQIGIEMLQLYQFRVKEFPYEFDGIAFQVNRSKEILPNTDLAGIEFVAYLDMLANLKSSEGKLILDCKVSGAKIPDFLVLDPQLQSYAWIEQTPHVGFLWFEKVTRGMKKGSQVTRLDTGETAFVIKIEEDDFGKRVYVGSSEKTAEENATIVPEELLTKQKVYVRIAKIPQKLIDERGRAIQQDVRRIHEASENNFFPQEGSIRFPEKCPICPYRGICSGDDELRDKLVQLDTKNDSTIYF